MWVERWGRQEWVELCHSWPRLGLGACIRHCHCGITWDAAADSTCVRSKRRFKHFIQQSYTLGCVYLGLLQTGRVCPFAPVVLRTTPAWTAKARVIYDVTSWSTQTPCDTHTCLTGLDSWIHTGTDNGRQSVKCYKLTGISYFKDVEDRTLNINGVRPLCWIKCNKMTQVFVQHCVFFSVCWTLKSQLRLLGFVNSKMYLTEPEIIWSKHVNMLYMLSAGEQFDR